MTALNQSRREMDDRLIEQASQNPSFRQQLLTDPKAALAAFLGVTLPPGMVVTVLEEQPGHHYLVLPSSPPSVDALPLDELELALVGGGRTLRPFGADVGNNFGTKFPRRNGTMEPGARGISSC